MSGIVARFETSGGFALQVDIEVGPDETVVVLGPNGAGKSTLVHALAGLRRVASGRIELGGVVVDAPGEGRFIPPEQRNVGVVFQDYLLFPHMTVLENVEFGLRARRSPEARERAMEWLRTLEIEHLADRRPGQISGGQAQRTALARALVTHPAVLLLDEPLSALDVSARAGTRRLLESQLRGFAGPRLLITHDAGEAFTFADRIYVLEEGRITQEGLAEEIRLRPKTPYVAEFAGQNLIKGVAADGVVSTGRARLVVADHSLSGPVALTIDPRAISVHAGQPEGSARNAWLTPVDAVEDLGERCRIRTGDPLPLIVEITKESVEALSLRPGVDVWVAIKATEIRAEAS